MANCFSRSAVVSQFLAAPSILDADMGAKANFVAGYDLADLIEDSRRARGWVQHSATTKSSQSEEKAPNTSEYERLAEKSKLSVQPSGDCAVSWSLDLRRLFPGERAALPRTPALQSGGPAEIQRCLTHFDDFHRCRYAKLSIELLSSLTPHSTIHPAC